MGPGQNPRCSKKLKRAKKSCASATGQYAGDVWGRVYQAAIGRGVGKAR